MPDNSKILRYTNIPLPQRKYIPGQGWHPDRDPQGSHIPRMQPDPRKFTVETWQMSRRYLYGIDLFNLGYWWEAHEVLEKLWIQAGRTTLVARFIQGIIQISAALLKDTQSVSPRGVSRLVSNGLAKVKVQPGVYLGIDVEEFVRQVDGYFAREGAALPTIALLDLDGE